MKFSYWLARILGSTALLIISLIGLGIVVGIAAGGYYLKDQVFVNDIINSINKVIDGYVGNFPTGAPIPNDVQQLIDVLNNVKTFFTTNKDLIINIGNGAFIGAIVFGSILIISLIGWLCLRPAYKKSKKPVNNRPVQQNPQQGYYN